MKNTIRKGSKLCGGEPHRRGGESGSAGGDGARKT